MTVKMSIYCMLYVVFLCGCACKSTWENRVKFDCKGSSDFCNSIQCEKIRSCSTGRIVHDASYCKCCDACIEEIEEGEQCISSLKGPLEVITNPICKGGMKCVENKCVRKSGHDSCLMLEKIYKELRGVNFYAEDMWIPVCDQDGHFRAKQMKKKKSICSDSNGVKLFGQEESDLSENMTCGCSCHMHELQKVEGETFMTRPQEHCTTEGNFDILQCIQDLCYCASSGTGKVQGRIVKMKYRDKLPCYREEMHEPYLKPCERELQRTRLLIFQFRHKGIDIIGLEKVECDPDGTFSPKQCDSSGCACTDENGKIIRSYHTDDHNIQAKMKCSCARDIETTATHAQYPTFNCDSWGNYLHFQCLNPSQCFCVDEDGDVISEELNRTIANEEFCVNMLKNLNTEIELPDATTSTPTAFTDDDTDYTDYENG